MRILLTLTVGSALLLTAGCDSGRPSSPGRVSAEQPGTAGAVSIAPVSNSPTRSAHSTATQAPATRAASTHARAAHPAASAPSAAVTAPHTEQVIRRPVTGTGRAAPGYTVTVLPAAHRLDCRQYPHFSAASPSAVDDGIAACLPSMEYALACWKGPTATTVLCYRNPWQRQVVRVNIRGPLPATRAPEQPTPLGLVLSDGRRCFLRDGGAWADLDGQPEMFGIYSCEGRTTVWASHQSDGINRTHALWSVQVAPMSGHGRLRTVSVRTAYFVGTSPS